MSKSGINKNSPRSAHDWIDLLKHAPCGYLLTDRRGKIITANDFFLEWVQYQKKEVEGKKRIHDFLPIGEKLFYETKHLPLLQLRGIVDEVNYNLKSKDGERKEVLLNSQCFYTDQGIIDTIQFVMLPFSERSRFEKDLIAAKKEAQQAAKTKSHFLATMSHEIRTPIHAVMSASRILVQLQPREDQKALIEVIQDASENLLKLITSILDLSKIEAGAEVIKEDDVNLGHFIEKLINVYSLLALENNTVIRQEIDPRIKHYVIIDEGKLSQILTNLLGNAIKFTREGEVILKVDMIEETDSQYTLRIGIQDSGIGMTENEIARIFEPFSQANDDIYSNFGGTGLGLSITTGLLKMIDSNLQVESSPKEGSTFSFQLTTLKSEKKIKTDSLNIDLHSAVELSKYKILVVDDQDSNLFIMKQFCSMWKLPAVFVASGEKAKEAVQREMFDLILMDISMSGMNGFETTYAIRALEGEYFKILPIIGLSAYESEDIFANALEVGMKDTVQKPFQPKKLYDKLVHQLVKFAPSFEKPSLEKMNEFFDNDPDAISEYLRMVYKDLTKIVRQVSEVSHNHSFEEYYQSTHKTLTPLRLLNLQKLSSKIKETHDLLASDQYLKESDENISDVLHSLAKLQQWIAVNNA